MTERIASAVFDSREEADRALTELRNLGVSDSAVSIVGQSIWSGLLVLSGSADTLTTYTGFSVVLFAGVAVLSLFVLRLREPDAPRPFKAIGFPVAPAIFALASALIVCNALYSDLVVPIRHSTAWGPAAAGLIVIGLGLPVYLVFSRRS